MGLVFLAVWKASTQFQWEGLCSAVDGDLRGWGVGLIQEFFKDYVGSNGFYDSVLRETK